MIRGSTLSGELFASVSVLLLEDGRTRFISIMSGVLAEAELRYSQHKAFVRPETIAGWSSHELSPAFGEAYHSAVLHLVLVVSLAPAVS
jgi:hypothetical protein